MERSGNPSSRGSFIETFNKEVFQDESYRSESKSEEDHNVSDDAFTSNNGSLGHHADMTNSDKRLSEARKIESLSRRETSSMRVWRVMLFLFILVTCAAVTSVIYIVLDRADTRDAALSVSYIVAHLGYASNVLISSGLSWHLKACVRMLLCELCLCAWTVAALCRLHAKYCSCSLRSCFPLSKNHCSTKYLREQ